MQLAAAVAPRLFRATEYCRFAGVLLHGMVDRAP
jgi:hypothetical protein